MSLEISPKPVGLNFPMSSRQSNGHNNPERCSISSQSLWKKLEKAFNSDGVIFLLSIWELITVMEA